MTKFIAILFSLVPSLYKPRAVVPPFRKNNHNLLMDHQPNQTRNDCKIYQQVNASDNRISFGISSMTDIYKKRQGQIMSLIANNCLEGAPLWGRYVTRLAIRSA